MVSSRFFVIEPRYTRNFAKFWLVFFPNTPWETKKIIAISFGWSNQENSHIVVASNERDIEYNYGPRSISRLQWIFIAAHHAAKSFYNGLLHSILMHSRIWRTRSIIREAQIWTILDVGPRPCGLSVTNPTSPLRQSVVAATSFYRYVWYRKPHWHIHACQTVCEFKLMLGEFMVWKIMNNFNRSKYAHVHDPLMAYMHIEGWSFEHRVLRSCSKGSISAKNNRIFFSNT